MITMIFFPTVGNALAPSCFFTSFLRLSALALS